jgi:hypothetical protein
MAIQASVYVLIGVGAIILIFFGVLIGRLGFTRPVRHKGTMRVLDLQNLQHGGDVEYMAITYKARLGWYAKPVESPIDKGMIWVQERYGPFRALRRHHAWNKADLIVVGQGRRAWAFHMPSAFASMVQARVDALIHQNGILEEEVAELRHQLAMKGRDVNVQVREGIAERVKDAHDLTPVPMQRRQSGGGQR